MGVITAILGKHDPETIAQLKDVAQRAVMAALMADGHLGYIMPIGGVAAYEDKVSVAGVGFDIACGNAALLTDLTLADIEGRLEEIADEIASTISFGLGRTNKAADAPVDHPLFQSPAWDALPKKEREPLREKARQQLGTVGGGNHYVDLFADTKGRIWIGVHFGSRGLGHTIATGFMALSQGKPWGSQGKEVEALLPLRSELGQRYWALMELAGQYAYAGREWVVRKVLAILGGRELALVHNHHNFAWKEVHGGRELIVVRKGATPAFPGQLSFVGGSMGDGAVILKGAENPDEETRRLQEKILFSTIHGAGRIMSRRAAKRGGVSREAMKRWLKARGITLRGGDVDEAPQVYRRLEEVLEEQKGTVEVVERLRPLVVVMAGPEVFDPYKD